MKTLFGRLIEMKKSQRDGILTIVSLASDGEIHSFEVSDTKQARVGDWVRIDEQDSRVQVHVLNLKPNNWTGFGLGLQAKQMEELKRWNLFRSQVHAFFTQESFLEILTPSIVVCPGTEPSIEVFRTEKKLGSNYFERFIITSPELHLKKALAMGFSKVFEIARVYRNGETTDRHRSEFLMLEWYRAFSGKEQIISDLVKLIEYLKSVFGMDFEIRFSIKSVQGLFAEFLKFNLTPATQRDELAHLASSHGLRVIPEDRFADIFYLLMSELIEPKLDQGVLTVVYGYPPSEAALAEIDQGGWGARFEIYWKGLELANAFVELCDPVIQRQRSEEDLLEKSRLGRTPISLDEEFFQALEQGMPPSCGIALGLERLYMAFFNINNIQELYLFRDQ